MGKLGSKGQAAIERSGAARRGQAAIESAAPTAGALHAQAAMEYLMTYGWALLVIVIVIAILIIMNPFSAPQSCKFDQIGFACDNAVVTANGTYLLMGLINGNNNAINVSGVLCTSSKTSTVPTNPSNVNTVVARQGTLAIGKTSPVSSGITCTGAPTAPGTDFSGKIWVFYKNTEDGADYPTRTASANIVTKVI